jgi:branched-chain amino acid transport system ATP-binding protein
MKVILELIQVTKRFGGLTAVDKVDIDLKEGEILGMIGPNGAGKSTIFNLITNTYKADSGKIIINGKNNKNYTPDQICKKGVGRTFQIVKPFGALSVIQNVMVGGFCALDSEAEVKKRALEIIEFVGLYQKKDALAYDLPIASMKRLELARVLATNPKMILLDEVMGGLNPTEIEQIMGLIKEINDSGCTLFVIEHVMKAIMSISDRIVVLHLGKKLMEGAPKEVVSNEEVVKAYLGDEYATA